MERSLNFESYLKRFLGCARKDDNYRDGDASCPSIFKAYTYGCLSLHHAICTRLSSIADLRRKKHGNLCSPFNFPTAQGRIKRVCKDISKGKSLEAAAIKISVAFYKEGCKPWFLFLLGQANLRSKLEDL